VAYWLSLGRISLPPSRRLRLARSLGAGGLDGGGLLGGAELVVGGAVVPEAGLGERWVQPAVAAVTPRAAASRRKSRRSIAVTSFQTPSARF
jgi:hypothetical protein